MTLDLPEKIVSDFIGIYEHLPVAKARIRESCTLVVATMFRTEDIIVKPDEPYEFSKSYGNEAKLKIDFPVGAVKTKCCLRVQVCV